LRAGRLGRATPLSRSARLSITASKSLGEGCGCALIVEPFRYPVGMSSAVNHSMRRRVRVSQRSVRYFRHCGDNAGAGYPLMDQDGEAAQTMPE
jgi:hypothetical protein